MRRPFAVTLIVALLAASVRLASAQGTARSLDLDPSPTSAGMGGASNAVFWGDPNHWANPALLAFDDGLRYAHMREQLVPGLATDVFFRTDRYVAAAGGVGASFAGHSRLDYGGLAYEDVKLWAVGASATSLIDDAACALGRAAPGIGRFADVAFGYSRKHVDLVLNSTSPFGRGSTPATDIGVLARVTPFDAARRTARPSLPMRLDLSYGHSIENSNDAEITFSGVGETAPTSRIDRDGLALRGTLGWPAAQQLPAWVRATLSPLISMGLAYEHESVHAGSGPENYHVTHRGLEVGIAQALWLRFGHVEDRLGDIVGNTVGWGVGVQTPYGGFRYDEGSVPQARSANLPDVHRRGFFLEVKPLAILAHRSPATGFARRVQGWSGSDPRARKS